MTLILSKLNPLIVVILSILGIALVVSLPLSTILMWLFTALHLSALSHNLVLITTIEDYIKATAIFIILMIMLFHLYQNYKRHVNRFLKKHFLIIKGFGILYVAILAIVPVLKSSLQQYGQLSPYHHLFIYLTIVIVFFCVFISSFDENIMGKQFRLSEIFVCLFLCMMGLALFFFLMGTSSS
ncbi:hypothetical protein DES39_0728 [Orbus hercynius]|uniref:Uncharacterized protein n=1 Tax=Orbus hercynius TaxID=593135 RepID=A0A495RJL2_9GAMM|nr:hypothetical protein [Orbus hercynius]RKS87494.1 hypothetical protein DES39_0728 [Orbus hercynius]